MSLREDKVNLIITINNDQGRKEFAQLDKQTFDLNEKIKELEENSKKYIKSSEKLSKVNDEYLKQEKVVTDLRNTLSGLTKGTSEYTAKEKELKKAEDRFTGIGEKVKSITKETNDLKKSNEEYNSSTEKLKEVKSRMTEVKASIGLTGLTTRELNQELKSLSAVKSYLMPGTIAFDQATEKIKAVKQRIYDLNQEVKVGESFWQRMKTQAVEFGTLAAGFLGFQFLTEKISNIVTKNLALSDSFADVRQTTGLTVKELDSLSKSLSDLDTRTNKTDLLGIVKVAGQFGIAKEELLDFTEKANKAIVVLKSEFGGGTDEITTVMAKLRNVLLDSKTDKISDDISHLGNALIVLAQKGVATAPVVADFANRIGGIGSSLGLTTPQILGLSATLQELAVSTERGGTAIGKILQKMSTNFEDFAKVAGAKSKEEIKAFGDLVNTDIYGAFLKFIDGAKRGGESSIEFANILKDSELSGAGAGEVIAKLANNHDLLTERVQQVGEAVKSTSTINEQYAIKNENLAASSERLGKRLSAWVSTDKFAGWIQSGINGLNGLMNGLEALPGFISRNVSAFIALSTAIAVYYANVISATLSTIANTTAQLANKVVYELSFKALILQTAATGAYNTVVELVTGRITIATAAQRLWNGVMAMNPIGATIAILGAAAVAINLYVENSKEAIELERRKFQLNSDLSESIKKVHDAQQNLNAMVDKFNEISPEEQKNVLASIKNQKEYAIAKLEGLQADQAAIALESSKASVWQTIGNIFTSGGNAAQFAMKQTTDAAANGAEASQVFADRIAQLKGEVDGLGKSQEKAADIINAEANAMKINAVSLSQWDEKLRLLRIALNNSVKDGEDYKRITSEINEVQKHLKTNTGATAEEIKKHAQEAKRAEQDLDSYLKKIQALDAEFRKSGMSKDDQDLQSIKDRYQPLIDQAKGQENTGSKESGKYTEERLLLEDQLQKALEAKKEEFRQRDLAAVQKAQDEIWIALQNTNDKEVIDEAEKWDKLIGLANKHGLDEKDLIIAKGRAISLITKKQSDDKVKQKEDESKKLFAIEKKQIEDSKRLLEAFAGIYTGIFDLMGGKQTEFALFQKGMAWFQNAINTGVAVGHAVVSASALPFPANLIAIAEAVGSVLSLMASSKKFIAGADVPKMESGGAIVPDGPSHSQGGLKIVDSRTNQVVAESESRELHVFSRKFVDNNPDLVRSIMDASNNNDGVIRRPIWLDKQTKVLNMPRVQQASRYQQFENGGRIVEFKPKDEPLEGKAAVNISSEIEVLRMMYDKNNQVLEKLTKKLDEPFVAEMSNRSFDKKRSEWDELKRKSRLG